MTTPTEATGRGSGRLTDAVSRLSADGRRALDVRPGGGHVVVPPQLGQEMLDQIDEDEVPAGHDQMSKSHDGPLRGYTATRKQSSGQHGTGCKAAEWGKVGGTFLTASLGEVS